MAIIHCPECNGTVSDQASSCPHCGYPIKKQGTKALIITFIAPPSIGQYFGRCVPEYMQAFVKSATSGNNGITIKDVRYGEIVYLPNQVTQNVTVIHDNMNNKRNTLKVNISRGFLGNVKFEETWG